MNRVASAPSCSAFIHRDALEEVSGHRVLIKSKTEKSGLLARGTNTRLRLEFLRETGLNLSAADVPGAELASPVMEPGLEADTASL